MGFWAYFRYPILGVSREPQIRGIPGSGVPGDRPFYLGDSVESRAIHEDPWDPGIPGYGVSGIPRIRGILVRDTVEPCIPLAHGLVGYMGISIWGIHGHAHVIHGRAHGIRGMGKHRIDPLLIWL